MDNANSAFHATALEVLMLITDCFCLNKLKSHGASLDDQLWQSCTLLFENVTLVGISCRPKEENNEIMKTCKLM